MEEGNALFKLQLAMGWATFLLVPATVIAAFVYPPAVVALAPLSALGGWNWRRMLNRESEAEVMTKPPTDRG